MEETIRQSYARTSKGGRKDKRQPGDAMQNSLVPVQLGMEDDIMNLIDV